MLSSEIYNRFKKGNYSKEDFQAIKNAMLNKEGGAQLDVLMKQDWNEINKQEGTTDKDLSHILHNIHFKLNEKDQHSFSWFRKAWNQYSNLAGILLILLVTSISILYFSNSVPSSGIEPTYAEIHTPLGSRSKFELPDGTTGWLNTGSVIKYQIPFKKRHVSLIGEAFFDVVHDENSPFSVEFSGLNVNVLGTSFNIMAYDDDPTAEVILVDGVVKITDQSEKFSTKLDVNQKFSLDKEKNTAFVENIDAENYVAWKEGKLIFRNEPLPEVVKRLGRWYNVEFVLADKELYDICYRATFVNEQLSEILRLFSLSSPISYEIEDRKMDENYEFLKKRIILKYNKTNN